MLQYFLGLRSSHPAELSIQCTDLSNSSIKDLIFVSVDTEFLPNDRKRYDQQSELGISILDTRDLHRLTETAVAAAPQTTLPAVGTTQSRKERGKAAEDILETRNWCVGSRDYYIVATRKYVFGEPIHAQLEDLKPCFESMIPEGRAVVLVTHAGNSNDLRYLQQLEIEIPNLIYTIDTQNVARHALRLTYPVGLRELLNILEGPSTRTCLHNAGNDANFTLRALLLLSLKELGTECYTKEQSMAVEMLTAIARFPRRENKIEEKERSTLGQLRRKEALQSAMGGEKA